jgi:hypothetical protein
MIRKAKAVWRGTGRDGGGKVFTESGVLAETPYSFRTRFENEKGTNPEELIAAEKAPNAIVSRCLCCISFTTARTWALIGDTMNSFVRREMPSADPDCSAGARSAV